MHTLGPSVRVLSRPAVRLSQPRQAHQGRRSLGIRLKMVPMPTALPPAAPPQVFSGHLRFPNGTQTGFRRQGGPLCGDICVPPTPGPRARDSEVARSTRGGSHAWHGRRCAHSLSGSQAGASQVRPAAPQKVKPTRVREGRCAAWAPSSVHHLTHTFQSETRFTPSLNPLKSLTETTGVGRGGRGSQAPQAPRMGLVPRPLTQPCSAATSW